MYTLEEVISQLTIFVIERSSEIMAKPRRRQASLKTIRENISHLRK